MSKKNPAKKQNISPPEKSDISRFAKLLRSGRLWLGITGVIFCVIIISISNFANIGLPPSFIVERARVRAITHEYFRPDHYLQSIYVGSQIIEVEILTGDFAGERIEMENVMTRFSSLQLSEGMDVMVSRMPDVEYLEAHSMSVYGPSRAPILFGAIALLVLSMIIMGRKKGLYAAVSLAFTLVTVVFFMVAFIIRGYSPVVFALLTAVITTSFTLFMVGDFSLQSVAAVAGAWAGLVAAGLLSVIIGRISHVSGVHMDHAQQLLYNSPPDIFLRIPELFFAAVIIASSGAVVDASMSISSSVFEIKEQSPSITAKRLYRSGMNIGGDILGANSNTLILAFAGSSITTILLIVLFGFPYLRIINLDLVAIEIIQSVAATMGMIITIPATALLSAALATSYEKKGKAKTRAVSR
jgi:uncharacterized membrane protein